MSDLRPSRTSTVPSTVPSIVPTPRSEARRLRVAVVAETFPLAEDDRAASVGPLLEHLRRRGHDAVLVCRPARTGRAGATGGPGDLPDSLAGAPVVPVAALSIGGRSLGLPTRGVMRALAAFAPDVVHLAAPLSLGAAALAAANQLGVPTVAVLDPGTDPAALSLSGRVGGRLAGRFLAADVTLRAEPLPTPRRDAEAGRLRRQWAPRGEVVVGYAGVTPPALAGLAAVPLEDGPGSPARRVLSALDLLVVGAPADDHEGAGPAHQALVERALASGVPVIGPATVGTAALVRHGLDGLLHAAGDRADLARCIEALAHDPHRRHWAGLAAASGAQRRARARFGDELVFRYREVIATATPATSGTPVPGGA